MLDSALHEAALKGTTMKAESTVRQHLRALRKVIENDSDPLVRALAYEIETAIRWAREDVVGWSDPVTAAREAARRLWLEFEIAPRE